MKKLLLLSLFVISLFACEKEQILLCEINNTFVLIFQNNNGFIHTLHINHFDYNVRYIDTCRFIVDVNDADKVSVTYHIVDYKIVDPDDSTRVIAFYKDTTTYMMGRPHACANYYYSW